MTCNDYQEMISCLIDDELSEKESRMLKEHIEHCENCRALYLAFSELSDCIGSDLADIPADLNTNIMAAIRRENLKPVKTAARRGKVAAMFVSAAAVAAIAIALPSLRSAGIHSTAAVTTTDAAVYESAAEPAPAMNGRAAGFDTAAENPAEESRAFSLAAPAAAAADFSHMEDESFAEGPEDRYDYYISDPEQIASVSAVFSSGTPAADMPMTSEADSAYSIGFADESCPTVYVFLFGDSAFYESSNDPGEYRNCPFSSSEFYGIVR